MRPASLVLTLAVGVVLAGAPARAVDPRLPLLVGEPGADEKLERFAEEAAQDPRLLAGLRAAAERPARERIHRALLALPAYAEAYAGFEARGDNAEDWQALLDRAAEGQRALRAHASYFLGRALLARDDIDGAAAALEAVRGPLRLGTPWTDEATLYLAYAYARIPELDGVLAQANRERARGLLASLLPERAPRYPEAPERVVEGAAWLWRELDGEGMGPLLELAKRMETIQRLIRRSATGQPTQSRQEEVVAAIDKLIELMREQEGG